MKCSGFSAAMTIKEKSQLKKRNKKKLFYLWDTLHVQRSRAGGAEAAELQCALLTQMSTPGTSRQALPGVVWRHGSALPGVIACLDRRTVTPRPLSVGTSPTILPIQAVTSLGTTGEVTSFGRAPVNALASLINNRAAYFCLWLFFIVRLLRWQVLCQKATKLLPFMGYITALNPV